MHRASLASTRIGTAIRHAVHEFGTTRRRVMVSCLFQFTIRTDRAMRKLASSDDLSMYP